LKRDTVPAFVRGEEMPRPAPQWMVRSWPLPDKSQPEQPAKLKDEELIHHAASALRGFNEALKLEPKNGLYQLGRASLLEEFAAWKDAARPASVPDELKNLGTAVLREAYGRALALSLPADSGRRTQPIAGVESLASHEAASALVRLATSDPRSLTEAENKQVTEARAVITRLEALPPGPITPVVFSPGRVTRLSDLLDARKTVDFDLRGYGWRERWTWVKPALGFLVWDPLHTARITSARQMFGGYTFQIFRDTGYDALAALDDDGDGVLTGPELEGISVWFDRNGDGKSSPDEVIPLRQFGVASISVKAASFDGIHPMNPRGITFHDGRVLPTWDWMVEPVREKAGRLAAGKREDR
jgi:hypothetical protein